MEELKGYLRTSFEDLLCRLDDRLLEDQDGRDYIVAQIDRILNILARASTLFNEGNSTTLG